MSNEGNLSDDRESSPKLCALLSGQKHNECIVRQLYRSTALMFSARSIFQRPMFKHVGRVRWSVERDTLSRPLAHTKDPNRTPHELISISDSAPPLPYI